MFIHSQLSNIFVEVCLYDCLQVVCRDDTCCKICVGRWPDDGPSDNRK